MTKDSFGEYEKETYDWEYQVMTQFNDLYIFQLQNRFEITDKRIPQFWRI